MLLRLIRYCEIVNEREERFKLLIHYRCPFRNKVHFQQYETGDCEIMQITESFNFTEKAQEFFLILSINKGSKLENYNFIR